MTYVDEAGKPVVCNISFFHKEAIIGEVNSLRFTGNGGTYSLNNIRVLLTRPAQNEVRITSVISIEDILNLFQSKKIVLEAVIDSVQYIFMTNAEFLHYREQFLNMIVGNTNDPDNANPAGTH
jgi:hypothetical protein